MYVTFGSSVSTTTACAYHYLQCEICATQQGKTRYVYYDYSKMLGHNCCSCYKNYRLTRNSSVLQRILIGPLLKTRHLDPGEALQCPQCSDCNSHFALRERLTLQHFMYMIIPLLCIPLSIVQPEKLREMLVVQKLHIFMKTKSFYIVTK